jgi:phage head maturation protease
MVKLDELKDLYLSGGLTEDLLESEGVKPGDFIALRNDTSEQTQGVAYAPERRDGRSFQYVFVTESAIGQFRDLPLAESWSLDDFESRKAPVLYHHDSYAGPVGRAYDVRKGVEYQGVKALTGMVEFAPEGLSPQADFAYGLVNAGLLNGGSVGFRVEQMREPTKEERQQFGLGQYSAVFEKCNLTEFSVLGVGRDPLAGVIYSADGQSKFEEFISSNPDRFDADVVREFREFQYTGEWKAPERIMIQVDKPTECDPERELADSLVKFGLTEEAAEEVIRVARSRAEENQVRVVTNCEWSAIVERIAALESKSEEGEVVEEQQQEELPEDLLSWSIEQIESHLAAAQGDGK